MALVVVLTIVTFVPAPQARAEGWEHAAGDCYVWVNKPYFWINSYGVKKTWGEAYVYCRYSRFVEARVQVMDADYGPDDAVTGVYRNKIQVPAGQYVRVGTGPISGVNCTNNKDTVGKEELYARTQIIVGYLKSQWVKSSERSAWCG